MRALLFCLLLAACHRTVVTPQRFSYELPPQFVSEPAPTQNIVERIPEPTPVRAEPELSPRQLEAIKCAKDSAEQERRVERRRQREAKRLKDEEETAKLVAYKKAHCTFSTRGVRVSNNTLEFDQDGRLRRGTDTLASVSIDCPPNGPPGARGHIELGTFRPGQEGRVALSTSEVIDNLCEPYDPK